MSSGPILATVAFPSEPHLRFSHWWVPIFAGNVLAALWLVSLVREHFPLALGVAAPIWGGSLLLLVRARRRGAMGAAALAAGRIDEARTQFTVAARQSRPFPLIHAAQIYGLGLVELQEGHAMAALSLLSSSWKEAAGSLSLRASIAQTLAAAWELAGDAQAAEAWRGEANSIAQRVGQQGPTTGAVARELGRLRAASFVLTLLGALAFLGAASSYPPLVMDQALVAGIPFFLVGACSWAGWVWRWARRSGAPRYQLWQSLPVAVAAGGLGMGLAAGALALALNVSLDRSPTLDWRGAVVDLQPHSSEPGAVRVKYLDPRDSQTVAEEVFSGALGQKLSVGAATLRFRAHRGWLGIAWIDQMSAE